MMAPPEILYHFTSKHAARDIARDKFIRAHAPLPPRWADRREALPDVVFLTADQARSPQRWAGAPSTGVRGLGYLDRAAVRLTVRLDPRLGIAPRAFRSWALDHNVPLAWIDEFRRGGSTDGWYVLERDVLAPEWVEVAIWNGLAYVPALTRTSPRPRRGGVA